MTTIVLTTPADGEHAELDRIPLFEIDGETYTMPGEVKPYWAIRYLWMIRQEGPEVAAAWIMEQMLGKDGFEVLASYEDLTRHDMQAIMEKVRDHTMGSMEEGKASTSSRKGRNRYPGSQNT